MSKKLDKLNKKIDSLDLSTDTELGTIGSYRFKNNFSKDKELNSVSIGRGGIGNISRPRKEYGKEQLKSYNNVLKLVYRWLIV